MPAVGDTLNLRYWVAVMNRNNDGALNGRKLIWTSSDSAVATVDSSGLVTGRSAGHATISARSWQAASSITTVYVVTVPDRGITGTWTGHYYDPNDTVTVSLQQNGSAVTGHMSYGYQGMEYGGDIVGGSVTPTGTVTVTFSLPLHEYDANHQDYYAAMTLTFSGTGAQGNGQIRDGYGDGHGVRYYGLHRVP